MYELGRPLLDNCSDITPTSCLGYTIFYTQIMFALLFLTAVVNRIVGYSKGTQ